MILVDMLQNVIMSKDCFVSMPNYISLLRPSKYFIEHKLRHIMRFTVFIRES